MDWKSLYDFQDRALGVLARIEHEFYLSGGTALSRGYYGHRYSEDLDFFVNDRPEFELWRDRCIEALTDAFSNECRVEVVRRDARFGRAFVHAAAPLKIEFINDVPCRIGTPFSHPSLGRLDTKENILANKVTAAIDRHESKDGADIFWLCGRDNLDISRAVIDADGKAAGVFPPLLAKRLIALADQGTTGVCWIKKPSEEEYQTVLRQLADHLIEA